MEIGADLWKKHTMQSMCIWLHSKVFTCWFESSWQTSKARMSNCCTYYLET